MLFYVLVFIIELLSFLKLSHFFCNSFFVFFGFAVVWGEKRVPAAFKPSVQKSFTYLCSSQLWVLNKSLKTINLFFFLLYLATYKGRNFIHSVWLLSINILMLWWEKRNFKSYFIFRFLLCLLLGHFEKWLCRRKKKNFLFKIMNVMVFA